MLFSKLYKVMVDAVTFIGFSVGDCPPGSAHASKPGGHQRVKFQKCWN